MSPEQLAVIAISKAWGPMDVDWYDPGLVESVAEAIWAERHRCGAIAFKVGEEIKADGNAIMGRPSSVAYEVSRRILSGE